MSFYKWMKDVSDIARNIPKNKVGVILKKDLIIQPNEKAVIVINGEVTDVIDSGKIRVGGLLKPGNFFKDVDVVIMDTSPKDLNWNMGELWTTDKQKLVCSGLIRFRIGEIKRFFSMVYAYSTNDKKGERALGVQDIHTRLQSEVLTRVLEPEISRMPMEDIYGNRDLQIRIENELETQLEQTLDMWGLELLKHTVEWDLGEYKTVLDACQEFQTGEELAELDTLAEEKKYEDIGRLDVAKVCAGQASVSVGEDFRRGQELKDVQAQIERERLEDEADMKAAREALKLKEEMHLSKARGMRAGLEVEQDIKTVTEADGADAAKTISEGRELGNLSSEQIEGLAKVSESEVRGRVDKVEFMKEIEERERDEEELKSQKLEYVNFSVTAPFTMALGKSYVLDVWTYLAEQYDELIYRAREGQSNKDIIVKSKSEVEVARGTLIAVHFNIQDLIVEDSEDTILWTGEISNATFPIYVPANTKVGSHIGKVTFYIDGIQISKIYFTIEINHHELHKDHLKINTGQWIKSAFISYATDDRNDVLNCLFGIRKVLPEIDLFLDVVSLRSGEKWKNRLICEIERRDIFYLFWSLAASRSKFVEMEWRTALERKGIEYIDPVPLISPEEVPPPKELAELHFNDWLLAYRRGKGS